MALTLVAVAAIQIVMPTAVRPHLIPPAHTITAFDPQNIQRIVIQGDTYMTVSAPVNIPGAWIIANQTITPAGRAIHRAAAHCLSDPHRLRTALLRGVQRLDLRQRVTYQPADRYWTFQWLETAILLVLAGALAAG